jgi:hypothetical protein
MFMATLAEYFDYTNLGQYEKNYFTKRNLFLFSFFLIITCLIGTEMLELVHHLADLASFSHVVKWGWEGLRDGGICITSF